MNARAAIPLPSALPRVVLKLLLLALLVATTAWPKASPALTSGLASDIAAGGEHACALTGAEVLCWGRNLEGQLGDGTITARASPVRVLSEDTNHSVVAAGLHFTCAFAVSDGVTCWGNNVNGQLGDGMQCGPTCITPVATAELTSGVANIAAGLLHACALTVNGAIKCWGRNFEGQLGDGTNGNLRTTPVDVSGFSDGAIAVSAGDTHTCAVTTAGGVRCWGRNAHGQLGDGTTTSRPVPADVPGLADEITAIAAGVAHTCALTAAGSVKCWGLNEDGQLGDGTTESSTVPVGVVGLGSDVAAIAAGFWHTCAVTMTGGVRCWGENSLGHLGDGTTTSRSTPVDVVGLSSGAIAVSAGESHTCALTVAGGVTCWGWNVDGQLGDGTNTSSTIPVDVSGIGPKAAGDVDCNGTANSIDAFLILQLDAGLIGSLACPGNADVDEDGSIDAIDALLILQSDAGLRKALERTPT